MSGRTDTGSEAFARTHGARSGGAGERRCPRRRRRAVALVAALAVFAPLLAIAGTQTAGAQLTPCQGGPGSCITTLDYSQGFSFTGTGTCEWTVFIDWGDGTSETQTFVVSGVAERSFPHRYPTRGLYIVTVDGSGVPIGGTTTCTFSDFSTQVEIVNPNLVCLGRVATIIGTSGSDNLRGTRGSDVILGLGGNDVIQGGAGNDLICGGPGADELLGGRGIDGILGGPGRDVIRGGADSDVLNGQGGTDRIFGEGGVDVIVGGGSRDFLNGGSGNDVIAGNKGNDVLRGNGGRDNLNGGPGTDRCIGGPGRDRQRNCER